MLAKKKKGHIVRMMDENHIKYEHVHGNVKPVARAYMFSLPRTDMPNARPQLWFPQKCYVQTRSCWPLVEWLDDDKIQFTVDRSLVAVLRLGPRCCTITLNGGHVAIHRVGVQWMVCNFSRVQSSPAPRTVNSTEICSSALHCWSTRSCPIDVEENKDVIRKLLRFSPCREKNQGMGFEIFNGEYLEN